MACQDIRFYISTWQRGDARDKTDLLLLHCRITNTSMLTGKTRFILLFTMLVEGYKQGGFRLDLESLTFINDKKESI